MSLDALVLSRVQFAWVIAWRLLLPPSPVGFAAFIAVLVPTSAITERRSDAADALLLRRRRRAQPHRRGRAARPGAELFGSERIAVP